MLVADDDPFTAEMLALMFLQKPIDIVKLPDMVERLLHGDCPPPGKRMAA